MNEITFPLFLALLLTGLWLLTGIILLLHRYSTIMGLFPLTAVIGGMAAVMQLHISGIIHLEIAGAVTSILIGGYLFLPVVLVSLLIVYATNGSVQARVIFNGVMVITTLVLVIGFIKLYIPFAKTLPICTVVEISPRSLIAQALSLTIAIIMMLFGYQAIHNFLPHFLHCLAGGIALLFGVSTQTLIFHMIVSGGEANLWLDLGLHLAIKSILVLSLWPFLIFYLLRVAPKFIDSVADTSRPAFDFFSTPEQLETRAQYNYSLLSTISKINQLIVHSDNQEVLLQETCNALIELRKYHLVWIGTLDNESGKLEFIAQAGFSQRQVHEFVQNEKITEFHHAGINGQTVIVNDISKQKLYHDSWQQMMQATGCRGVG